jgi:5-methyltetrahydrofolate--homocysteine methyltransferase
MDFLKRLEKERLVFDGAMGTLLQAGGLGPGELPELWNITNSGAVADIHRAYLRAGSQIIKTNTLGANRLKLSGTGYSVDEVISAGVEITKRAATTDSAYIALDIGPTGRLLAPFGDLDFEEAVSVFAEMIIAGKRAGADIVLIETMNDTYEIKAAMLAAKENCGLPVLVTFTPDPAGRLLTGAGILTAICLIEALGADAVGLNCGMGPEQMKSLLPCLIKYASIPVIISPNAGMPEQVNGKTHFRVTPEEFAADMADIAVHARLIGGCCGTTPAHIAAMIAACKEIPPAPVSPKNHTVVSSYGKAVLFGGRTVIIGERINPTGKPRMKKALYDNDMEYIYREGLTQTENGVEILDVNVGLPGIDEKETLARAVTGLQGVTDAVLQIDTSDTAAAERALRLYNGKPLLNSVNGKSETLEAILPLVKKYGAAVVALTLDDNGIPDNAIDRIRIAETIIAEAAKHGIQKKDIIFDTLTMTISAGRDNAKITLEAMGQIRNRLGLHTVLGVSNISFGLPERERINAAFFTLAMSRGLSAGIVNPMNAAMMDAFYTYNTLSGEDANCVEYIERFSKQIPEAMPAGAQITHNAGETISLHDAIANGLRIEAGKIAEAMLADTPPLEIINQHLIPAIDMAGKDFESRKIFLPQLLMNAEAAKAAFHAVKEYMARQGTASEKRGKIVLLTVKGDIHDIGKNIVKILLENYNFQVIDLGKNVEPALVLETVLKEEAPLVGLSALMTTTVVYMEETIRLLKEKAPQCRIMVGGAVLTQEYAAKIGADFYSKDATGAVRYADELFRSLS